MVPLDDGNWVNSETGEVSPGVGPDIAVNPRTGEAYVPGTEGLRQQAPPPRSAPRPQQPSAAAKLQQEQAAWCNSVYSVAMQVRDTILITPTNHRLYQPLLNKWHNYRNAWAAECN